MKFFVSGSDERTKILRPGDQHYRAYVGVPSQYDFIGASQFFLLCAVGLRDYHKLLDFGCGSLRAGRMIIPYLNYGNYFGIEPNQWLVKDGIKIELGKDLVRIKKPTFSFNDDFDCGIFDKKFDYIIAQSILSHCGPDLLKKFLRNASGALKENGLLVFTYCEEDKNNNEILPPSGWHYPECVSYRQSQIDRFIIDAGLCGMGMPWYHPRQKWYVVSHSESALPDKDQLDDLRGYGNNSLIKICAQ